jgi:ankyrin repeat protein
VFSAAAALRDGDDAAFASLLRGPRRGLLLAARDERGDALLSLACLLGRTRAVKALARAGCVLPDCRTGSHHAKRTPFLERTAFLCFRRFLFAQGPTVSIPTRLDAFRLTTPRPTPFDASARAAAGASSTRRTSTV